MNMKAERMEEGSGGQRKWKCRDGNWPGATMCMCFQCHQEDIEQVKAIKTSSRSAPTHFKKDSG